MPVAGSLPSHPAVCVVDVAAPLAFCAGWLHPRIYVSTATLSLLSESELRAVLAHEHHHRARRDPLRLAVGRVLSQTLFFLPVLRPLHERYGDVAELTADAAALEATGGARGRSPPPCSPSPPPQRAKSWASRQSEWTRYSASRRSGACPGCGSWPR